jgi:hypothetical protein
MDTMKATSCDGYGIIQAHKKQNRDGNDYTAWRWKVIINLGGMQTCAHGARVGEKRLHKQKPKA